MAKQARSTKINGRMAAAAAAAFSAVSWGIEYSFRQGDAAGATGTPYRAAGRALTYGGLGLLAGVLAAKYDMSLGVGFMVGGGLTAASVSLVPQETTNPGPLAVGPPIGPAITAGSSGTTAMDQTVRQA